MQSPSLIANAWCMLREAQAAVAKRSTVYAKREPVGRGLMLDGCVQAFIEEQEHLQEQLGVATVQTTARAYQRVWTEDVLFCTDSYRNQV